MQTTALVTVEQVAGCIVTVRVAVGDLVRGGQPLMVLTSMKMETAVVAPVDGQVVAVAQLVEGDTVTIGEVLVVMRPMSLAANTPTTSQDLTDGWQDELDEIELRRQWAVIESVCVLTVDPPEVGPAASVG